MQKSNFNWDRHFTAYKEGSLGMKKYCEKHDISLPSFSNKYYKQRELDDSEILWSKVLVVENDDLVDVEFSVNNINLKVKSNIDHALLTLIIKSAIAI